MKDLNALKRFYFFLTVIIVSSTILLSQTYASEILRTTNYEYQIEEICTETELENFLALGGFSLTSSTNRVVILAGWSINVGQQGAYWASGNVNITVGNLTKSFPFSVSTAGLTSSEFGRGNLDGYTQNCPTFIFI